MRNQERIKIAGGMIKSLYFFTCMLKFSVFTEIKFDK